MGAFNTFFRNHNGFGESVITVNFNLNLFYLQQVSFFFKEQDPAALGTDVALASKTVIETRYSLLPYLYTLFYEANQHGGTVIRSLMQE